MGYYQFNRLYLRGFKGSRIPGFKGAAIKQADKNAKKLQSVEGLAKVISTLFFQTQILLAGDLGLIERTQWDTLKKDIAPIERMLKAQIKSFQNKPSNP